MTLTPPFKHLPDNHDFDAYQIPELIPRYLPNGTKGGIIPMIHFANHVGAEYYKGFGKDLFGMSQVPTRIPLHIPTADEGSYDLHYRHTDYGDAEWPLIASRPRNRDPHPKLSWPIHYHEGVILTSWYEQSAIDDWYALDMGSIRVEGFDFTRVAISSSNISFLTGDRRSDYRGMAMRLQMQTYTVYKNKRDEDEARGHHIFFNVPSTPRTESGAYQKVFIGKHKPPEWTKGFSWYEFRLSKKLYFEYEADAVSFAIERPWENGQ